MTGRKPSVLGILPFGCRAFAVKPDSQVNKRTLDPRSLAGINLGLSAKSPGVYYVWVPSSGRVVTTSDVYFLEHYFPCRKHGFWYDEDNANVPTPASASTSDGPGIPDCANVGQLRVQLIS